MNTSQVRKTLARKLDVFNVGPQPSRVIKCDSQGYERDLGAERRARRAEEAAVIADAQRYVAKLERAKLRRSNSQLVKLQRGNSQCTSAQPTKLQRAGHHVIGHQCSCGDPRCPVYPG